MCSAHTTSCELHRPVDVGAAEDFAEAVADDHDRVLVVVALAVERAAARAVRGLLVASAAQRKRGLPPKNYCKSRG